MKVLAKILGVLVLGMGMTAVTTNAGTGGPEAFEKLKSLAGTWEMQGSGPMKGTSTIEVTSGGSAVIERFVVMNGDKREEMITMFYLDGDQLKLTHYCAAGNQPTMVGTYVPETNMLTFGFVTATNLKSPNDGHMHHAVYKFRDKDHFQSAWTFRKDQKDAFAEEATYVRVR